MCKKIHRGGNAEQYHANKKYKEAVAVAVEACADDTNAQGLYKDPAATLDDLREAVTTLEDTDRTARQVLGGTHPTTVKVGRSLREARAALRAREESDVCEALRKAEV